jgi:hypothetical protein
MAQHDYFISNATFPAVRTDINNALSAIQTTNSGTSRPTGAVAGQLWLDTTSATTPTLKYYDGADDISLATIDHSANTVNWLDSTVSITGLSSTATGTVLTLTDSASTSTVNLIIDNQKEIRFRETTANGTNYVALKAPASVSSDLTFTLPATDGSSGQALVTNGSGVLSFASAGLSLQSVKTANFTAVKGEAYPCNTTSSSFTVTLPATPSAGDQVQIFDYAGTADTNQIIIDRNGNKIEGGTVNLAITGEREGAIFTYIDSTQGWLATSGVNEGTDVTSLSQFSADYLVIAGGGGGGGQANFNTFGGGGGAGGYRSFTSQFLNVATNYTVTIGAGGAGGSNATGVKGSDSVFSTITSTGGGLGGTSSISGGSGGSGGGGGSITIDNALGNFPSTSPSQGSNGGAGTGNQISTSASGGGGGSSAVGSNASASTGGAGGAGTTSSITGSSVTRAGGGGGAGTVTQGAGGNGGGGAGVINAGGGSAGAGTVNTGGGGGGGGYTTSATVGGAGGSGVVIIKYPDTLTVSNSGGGLTFSTSSAGGFKVTSFTAGTGTIQFN